MHRTLVLDVAGLTTDAIGPHTPHLAKLAARGGARPIQALVPAVGCATQATYLTGALPRAHGVVASGWYDRDAAEVLFRRTSNRLVSGDKLWDVARRVDPGFTCAQLFWSFNEYASVDWSVSPSPLDRGDGTRTPSLATNPPGLEEELRAAFGAFPFSTMWGPRAGIASSRWIGRATRHLLDTRRPTLTLVRLPHLDYDMQRFGPHHPRIERALREIDEVCGELIEEAESERTRVVVLSEYGIAHVDRPVCLNRILRSAGLLRVRSRAGSEWLDAGASEAFAVVDHQVAHVYVRRRERIAEVEALLRGTPGVDLILDDEGKRAFGIDHPRAGELVAIAAAGAWFPYYWWLDDAAAPELARTFDPYLEHARKPGADPVELFFDPALRRPRVRLARRVLERWLGLRTSFDVVPVDPTLVRGSHGRLPDRLEDGPVLLTTDPELLGDTPARAPIRPTDVHAILLRHVHGDARVEPAHELQV